MYDDKADNVTAGECVTPPLMACVMDTCYRRIKDHTHEHIFVEFKIAFYLLLEYHVFLLTLGLLGLWQLIVLFRIISFESKWLMLAVTCKLFNFL